MDFSTSFGWYLLIISCLDTCWLTINFKCWPNVIYPSNITSKPLPVIILCSLVCWIVSALYLAGHQYDTELKSLIEGAWTGALVYSIFNFTTIVMNKEWTTKTMLADIIWGTSLYAIASILTFKLGGI